MARIREKRRRKKLGEEGRGGGLRHERAQEFAIQEMTRNNIVRIYLIIL